MFNAIAVIPVYNHPSTIAAMTEGVLAHGLPCLLVDDGSEPACAAVIDQLCASRGPAVTLLRLTPNQGKGAAMTAGLLEAGRRGFTHALQIDADGQHDCNDIPAFIAKARQHPQAVICGCPIYDASVPASRLYARYLTHVFVWLNTLSLDIRDSMCGFRVYPLASTTRLVGSIVVGRRMDFDSDVIVRLHWRGVPVINQPTRVTYPQDGVSHFRLWRDNLLISRMHATLFIGMLARSPLLLWRKVSRP